MKVMVTGASGFVGGAVVRRLCCESRVEVVAATRKFEVPSVKHCFNNIGNFLAKTDWSTALKDVDSIVHCAAMVHCISDSTGDLLTAYRRINVHGSINLARQAVAAGVRRFVFISSIKVNGETTATGCPFTAYDIPSPVDYYAISKMEAEEGLWEVASKGGMELVIIRPPMVYGPGVKGNFAALMRLLALGAPLPFAAVKNNRRSLLGLDNLVDLIVTCIEHPAAANEVFLAGDGEDMSTAGLLKRLAMAMNRPARLFPVPVWLLDSLAALVGKREVMRRLCGSLSVDIKKNRDVLGWAPQVSVDEGLRRTAHVFCDAR